MAVHTSLVLILALAVTADAQSRFTHSGAIAVEVRRTERAKPPSRHDEPARPMLTGDGALRIEAMLGEVREDQAALLRDLISKTPDSEAEEKADELFRLGEIYAKQYLQHHLRATEATLAAGRETDTGRKAKADRTATDETAHAQQALLDAVRVYKTLTDGELFRNYPKLDNALFYFAYTLQTGGFAADARAAFHKLLVDFPQSRFVPEALFAFGEHAFEAGQLAEAESRYREVIKFPKAAIYWYAQYKLGWVQLNLGRPQDALETFYQVAVGTAHDRSKEPLWRAAKHDFVRAYAEIGRADKALPAFQRVDSKDGLGMLATLGDLYLGQGKSDKAVFVFRQLIAQQPASPTVCAWQANIARAMLTIGTPSDRVHEIEQLVRLYAAVHTRLPAAEASECHDAAAEMSGELARAYHQEAQKTQNVEYIGYSDRLYRAYLAAFRDARDFGETQYYHAELMWIRAEMEHDPRLATERWQAAGKAFTDVVETGKLDAHLVQVSADAAMQAWMRALAIDPRAKPTPPDERAYDTIPQPKPLPDHEAKLLAAYDGYLAHVKDPKDAERVDVEFLKADLLRRFDHHEEALALFRDLLVHHRDHEDAEIAAQLALDSLNRMHREVDMLALVKQLQADTKFLDGKEVLKSTLAKLVRQSLRKEAERCEAAGRRTNNLHAFVECGQKYLDIYNLSVEAPDADELLFNAGVSFEMGRSISAAKTVYELLQKLFPTSKLAARSIVRLGHAYAQAAFYKDASEKYELYATKYAGEQDAYDALSDAVIYRKGLGDDTKAIDDTRTYIKLYGAKHPVDAASAFWSLTAIYEKQGELDQVVRHLHAYLDRYGAIGSQDRVVIAWSKIGQALWQQACPVPTVDGMCARADRESVFGKRVRRVSTRIRKQCGDETKVKLTIVPRDPGKVARAMAAFGAAIAAYDKVAGATGGDVRGALYQYGLARFGRADRDFEQLGAIEMPGGLSFDPRNPAVAAKSKQRFETWFTHKRDLGTALFAQYDAIVALHDGATAIASAARRGQISQAFAGQLFRADVPEFLRTGAYAADAVDAYCEQLESLADPLETIAVESYQACLGTSTRLGWFSEWSRLCERELGQLRPELWPTASELRHSPDQVSTIIDREPPIAGRID